MRFNVRGSSSTYGQFMKGTVHERNQVIMDSATAHQNHTVVRTETFAISMLCEVKRHSFTEQLTACAWPIVSRSANVGIPIVVFRGLE